MYLTGDWGRMHADGMTECLGRIDNEVKLHGLRMERAGGGDCVGGEDMSRDEGLCGGEGGQSGERDPGGVYRRSGRRDESIR